jgi:hypothetical protein
MHDLHAPQAARTSDDTTLLAKERAKIVGLIAGRAPHTTDRYADLRSQCRTSAASDLIFLVYGDLSDWEQKNGKRVHQRRGKSGVVFVDALRRFVGDLLRVMRPHCVVQV